MTMIFTRQVKGDLELRMVMEASYDKFYVSAVIFLGSWVALLQ